MKEGIKVHGLPLGEPLVLLALFSPDLFLLRCFLLGLASSPTMGSSAFQNWTSIVFPPLTVPVSHGLQNPTGGKLQTFTKPSKPMNFAKLCDMC